VFRALGHEGIATDCLFELLAGDRRLSGEKKVQAYTACAVLAVSLKTIRDPLKVMLVQKR
jgi:hypothetical protein